MSLRKKLIRIAYNTPSVRTALLQVLADADSGFDKWIKGRKFHNPDTGNRVEFGSLPDKEQARLRGHYAEFQKNKADEGPIDPKTKQRLESYKLSVFGGKKSRAEYVAKKIEEGIKATSDICKLSPPICASNLGITRDNMPQVLDKSVKALLASEKPADKKKGEAAVKAGADPKSDKPIMNILLDDLKKEGVKIDKKKVPVGKLKATQEEIKADKTFGMADAYFKGEFNPAEDVEIIISKDGHILDGHHRWAALLVANPSKSMNCIQVDLTMKDFLRRAFKQPGVFRADISDNIIDDDKPVNLGDGPEKIKRNKSGSKKLIR